MKVKVTKVHGNNNTFILLFNPDFRNSTLKNKKIIQKLCKIKKNKLVDGLLVLKYLDKKNIYLDYYNNDGTWETFCANGLRCAALYIYNKFKISKLVITCGDGAHQTKKIGNNISTSMPKPKYKDNKISIHDIEGYFINSGANHYVLPLQKKYKNKNAMIELAQKIRYSKDIFPDGVNVNFYQIYNRKIIKVITYEKGIEKIVDSCASGSFACAYHLSKNKLINKNITALNLGGELKIKFSKNFNNNNITSTATIGSEYILEI